VRADRESITVIWSRAPSGDQVRALGHGVRGQSPLKLNAFLHLHNPRSWPISPKIFFFRTKNFDGRLGPLDSSGQRVTHGLIMFDLITVIRIA